MFWAIYLPGLVGCWIYFFFFHEDEKSGDWKSFCFLSILWPILVPVYVCVWLVTNTRIDDWRNYLFEKCKRRKLGKQETPQLPLPTIEQKVSDYRTPVTCSECGK